MIKSIKYAERSSSSSITQQLLSMARGMSPRTFIKADSVLWFFLYADRSSSLKSVSTRAPGSRATNTNLNSPL